MSRLYPSRPIVGVGAVILRDGEVLIVRRANPPLQGEWSIPGGALDLGEKLRDGVAREVREETGLDVEVGPVLDVFDSIFPDSEGRTQYHYVLIDYLCHALRNPGCGHRCQRGPLGAARRIGLARHEAGHDRGDPQGLRSRLRKFIIQRLSPSELASQVICMERFCRVVGPK